MDILPTNEYSVLMSETGKRRSTLEPGSFARQVGEYVWHLVDTERGDRSGRWLAERTERSKGYWEKILNLRQALTTNDIQLVAELFEISPYQLVRDARTWGEDLSNGTSVDFIITDVSGAAENVDPHEIDLTNLELAASKDASTVTEQNHPDYEDESQDTEHGE